MPSSHLILCRSLFLLPPIPPSIRVLSNESTLRMRWPKYWSFSFSIIPWKNYIRVNSIVMSFIDKCLRMECACWSLYQFFKPWNQIGCHSAFLSQVNFCPNPTDIVVSPLKMYTSLRRSCEFLMVFLGCFSKQFGKCGHDNISSAY